KDLKAEGYQFLYKKQKYAPSPKDTPQTLAEMLYKVQSAVETISGNPKLIRAWVKHLPN
ncbi:22382_t:CDS:2, partial [Racocetra persica]